MAVPTDIYGPNEYGLYFTKLTLIPVSDGVFSRLIITGWSYLSFGCFHECDA